MRENAVFDVIVQLLRRQFRFYAAIIALAIIGTVAAHGWSWASAVVIVIAAIVIPSAFVLTAFWISVFRNIGRKKDLGQPGDLR
ncbi:MAG: hypothetical protein EXR03_10320 [Pseudolabrys sp.]|nr:hypothetical protein [Pseudolabrys sp.]MSP33192.1 hypothetical protein [Pseudolabrys sp.]